MDELKPQRILIVEDNFDRISWFRAVLGDSTTIVRHPEHAVDALRAREFDLVFLDGDLICPLCLDGIHVAKFLAEIHFAGKVAVHSANWWLAKRIEDVLGNAGIRVRRAEFDSARFDRVMELIGVPSPRPAFPMAALACVEQEPEPEPEKIVWEFWRASQSEFRYREIGVVDLGEIG